MPIASRCLVLCVMPTRTRTAHCSTVQYLTSTSTSASCCLLPPPLPFVARRLTATRFVPFRSVPFRIDATRRDLTRRGEKRGAEADLSVLTKPSDKLRLSGALIDCHRIAHSKHLMCSVPFRSAPRRSIPFRTQLLTANAARPAGGATASELNSKQAQRK